MTVRPFQGVDPILHPTAYVDAAATVIGNVTIGADSSVWPGAVIRGDVNNISIGERTSIQDNVTLHVTHKNEHNPEGVPLVIGNDVTIGHNAVLHACVVEDECLIGISAIVLDRVLIKKHTLLAAGALVTPGKVLDGGLWAGSPAKKMRELSEEEKNYFKYSGAHYTKLKNQY
ncbi:MAG: gamma carbonic anhydrase family protein [Gammaproteobacteria bacterium]|nr:gamma carbonic anhydrase family protein [Gammaproteobacteria bacterium]